jgi:hypothetical protein
MGKMNKKSTDGTKARKKNPAKMATKANPMGKKPCRGKK